MHDTDGTTWIATARGLIHYRKDTMKRYTVKDGLPHQAVYSLFAGNDYVWIGTHKGAIKMSKDWRPLNTPDLLKDLHISDIEKDTHGNLWFATNNGAYIFDGHMWERAGFFEGLADNRIFSITVEDNGILWFGTKGGISRYADGSFTSYSKGSGLVSEEVHDVVVDKSNNKWIATSMGISRMDDRIAFNNIGYTGIGAKGLLRIEDQRLNKKKNEKDTIQVTVKNLLLEKSATFIFQETGKNTGVFTDQKGNRFFRFVPLSYTREAPKDAVIVQQGYTNFLEASYAYADTDKKIRANALWEDVSTKGNLDGNAVADRFDAAIARKIRKGYMTDFPVYPGMDVNGDGKIGIEEEDYALAVNAGKIHPYAKKGDTASHTDIDAIKSKAFKPVDLPWDVWKISKEKGGDIRLDTLDLKIPPDALPENKIIEIYQGERTPSPTDLTLLPVGKGYNLHPVGLHFKKPIALAITYTKKDLKKWGITDEKSLRLGMWNKKRYEVIPSSVDVNSRQVTGVIHTFPDLLNRPNRPPFAPARTSPISNLLTNSNYFTILAVEKNEAQNSPERKKAPPAARTNQQVEAIAIVPAIQVIPPPQTKKYHAIGILSDGTRKQHFQPEWSLEKREGNGNIDSDGNFTATEDGELFIKASKDGKSKKNFTAVGTCSWCHYFGIQCNCFKACDIPHSQGK